MSQLLKGSVYAVDPHFRGEGRKEKGERRKEILKDNGVFGSPNGTVVETEPPAPVALDKKGEPSSAFLLVWEVARGSRGGAPNSRKEAWSRWVELAGGKGTTEDELQGAWSSYEAWCRSSNTWGTANGIGFYHVG